MKLAIELLTDRSRVRGIEPLGADSQTSTGLIHPDDWCSDDGDGAHMYVTNSDGYIFCGSDLSGTWRPQIVRVDDNFLALRIRNLSDSRKLAMFSHVILVPRKRQPGRINLNTVTVKNVRFSGVQELYTSLFGLPGVGTAGGGLGDFALEYPVGADETVYSPWPSPTQVAQYHIPGALVPPASGDALTTTTDNTTYGPDVAALQMSALMMLGRPEHADGRYYTSLAELLRDSSHFVYDYDQWNNSGTIYPLSTNTDLDKRYAEALERFAGIASLATLRSDIFEITATVQSGYGLEMNGDGWIDYRNPDEFIVTAETKGRAVYERRAPSDQSDESDSSGGDN